MFEDHDGSWTWTIENSSPYEPDYKLIDRQDKFESRRDAQKSLMEAWSDLQAKIKAAKSAGEGESAPEPPDAGKQVSADEAPPQAVFAPKTKVDVASAGSLPEWGVQLDGQLMALFFDEKNAKDYAQNSGKKGLSVERVQITVGIATRPSAA